MRHVHGGYSLQMSAKDTFSHCQSYPAKKKKLSWLVDNPIDIKRLKDSSTDPRLT